MDQKKLREWEAKCIQEEPPACKAGCPLNVDARAFVLAMAGGHLDAARAVLEKSMPLAAITARLCEAPCEAFCVRGELGGSIAIGGLERICIQKTTAKGRILRLPARPKKIAVFGSAPSGLTVAFDLAKKGYPVTVFHLGDTPGGWLRELPDESLPMQVLDEELSRLTALHVEFSPAAALDANLIEAQAVDAVYVAQDDCVAPDVSALIGSPDMQTLAVERPGWFTGGMDGRAHRFISAVSHGREAAVSIDRYLQNASLTASRVFLRQGQTKLFTRTAGVSPLARVHPAGRSFTLEEARQEAGRCLDCQCLECVRHCVYLKDYDGYPKTYARRVFNNLAIVQGMRQANAFINSCSLCGQCETICPNDFSMAEMCLDARRQMVREGRMPPSAHWFALEEMRSARGAQAAFLSHARDESSSAALFFPGCQLAGIRPEQTLRLYEYLLRLEPRTGIWVDCCAAPAHWSGRVQEFENALAEMRTMWESMGRPVVVTACSTCLQMFREHLPEFEAQAAWPILARQCSSDWRVPEGASPLALSDPCTSRHDALTQSAIRELLAGMGQPLAELPMSGALTECCGFGGLMDNANPSLARKVAQARVEQSDADFLTYCAMCREQLARTGKPVRHILDLLFPETARPADDPPVGISARRVNRRALQKTLCVRMGRAESEKEPWEDMPLVISPEVRVLLEERRILEDDVRQVLWKSRSGGRCLRHGKDGRRIVAAELGEVTFWVEYRESAQGVELVKAWSHRMRITGGRL